MKVNILLLFDDFFNYEYNLPFKEKSEVLDKFKIFKTEIKKQHEKIVKVVRSYHDGKYYGQFDKFGQQM